jgi:HPt (histidine-containing phosphotransfer) domain-containing protein
VPDRPKTPCVSIRVIAIETGRPPYEAHLVGKVMGLLPPIGATTEEEARNALEKAMRCPLAARLLRDCRRYFSGELDARAYAACVTHRAKMNARMVSAHEITALARKIEPHARALRAAMAGADADVLAVLLPGSRDVFTEALNRLCDPRPYEGHKAKGGRDVLLIEIADRSWRDAFGLDQIEAPVPVIRAIMAEHHIRVPPEWDAAKAWIERRREKVKRSYLA